MFDQELAKKWSESGDGSFEDPTIEQRLFWYPKGDGPEAVLMEAARLKLERLQARIDTFTLLGTST